MPFPYVTQAELERELPFSAADFGIDDTETDADGNTAWDNLLTDLLEREAQRVEGWIGATFELTSVSEDLDGSGSDEQPLPNRPVQSVSSLSVDTRTGTETLDPSTDIYVADTHLELLEDAPIDVFPDRTRNVSVTYEHGYDGAPAPVREGIIRLVRKALDMIETDGVTQESEGSFSYTYQPPSTVRAAVRSEVTEFDPPSYYGGAAIL